MTFSLYTPKPTQVSVEEMERFVREECKPFVLDEADKMTQKFIQKAKEQGTSNFGEVRARELALRLILVSGGDILL